MWSWLVGRWTVWVSRREPHEHVPLHVTIPRTSCVLCGRSLRLGRGLLDGRRYWLTARGCADVWDDRRPVEGDGLTYGGITGRTSVLK